MAKTVLQREIEGLRRAERRFLRKQLNREPTKLDLLLEDKVPPKLEATLDKAFSKAFHLIFSKGSTIISKTFSTDKIIDEFEADTADLEELPQVLPILLFLQSQVLRSDSLEGPFLISSCSLPFFSGTYIRYP